MACSRDPPSPGGTNRRTAWSGSHLNHSVGIAVLVVRPSADGARSARVRRTLCAADTSGSPTCQRYDGEWCRSELSDGCTRRMETRPPFVPKHRSGQQEGGPSVRVVLNQLACRKSFKFQPALPPRHWPSSSVKVPTRHVRDARDQVVRPTLRRYRLAGARSNRYVTALPGYTSTSSSRHRTPIKTRQRVSAPLFDPAN